MAETLRIPIEVVAVVHPIEGGGYWAEVPALPGCVTQAPRREDLVEHLQQAVKDWLAETPELTQEDARGLAAIQGFPEPSGGPYPQPNEFLPPPDWSEEDE